MWVKHASARGIAQRPAVHEHRAPLHQHAPFAPVRLRPPRGETLEGVSCGSISTRGQSTPFENILCRFGAASPSVPLQHTDDWALCEAPPSYNARAVSFEHYMPFTDANNVTDGTVKLTTSGDAEVKGGVLRLTDPFGPNDYLSDRDKINMRSVQWVPRSSPFVGRITRSSGSRCSLSS